MTADRWITILFSTLLLFAGSALAWSFLILRRLQSELSNWKQGALGTALIYGLISWIAATLIFIAAEFQFTPLLWPAAILGLVTTPAAILLGAIARSKAGALVAFSAMAELAIWLILLIYAQTAIL